jgi:hypothetical protein
MEKILAYHFFGDTLWDGSAVPKDGDTLRVDPNDIKLCSYGLHASIEPFDALRYAPGPSLALVEISGRIFRGTDKIVGSERTIIRRIDAGGLLQAFARKCALEVAGYWDAPGIVIRYLETGDESLRYAARSAAARYAAESARSAAARYAAESAESAAWSAARYAAESAQYAARYAAQSAAWSGVAQSAVAWYAQSAAESAAWSAAESAARSAARSEHRRVFNAMVSGALK